MIKSPLFIIAFVIQVLLLLKIIEILDTSLFEFTEVYYYAIICTNLFLLVSTASFMSKGYDVLSFLERNRCKKIMVALLSSALLTLALSILPVGVMVVFNNAVTDIHFIKSAIVHFLIIWLSTNLLAATIGAVVGAFIQNGFATVLAIVVYLFFLLESTRLRTNEIFYRYLNIYDDYTFISANDLSGPIFNSLYVMDKLFIVLLIVLMLLIAYSFYTYRKRFLYISLLFITLGCMIFMVYQGGKEQSIAESQVFDAQDNVQDEAYTIMSYQMELSLTNSLKNIANLTIRFSEDVTELDLRLDDLFALNEVEIDGENVHFQRKDDLINVQSSFEKDQVIQVMINYEGKVSVENNLGVGMYYVHDRTINLPGHIFAWYPQSLSNENSQAIQFDVEIQTPALLFSNINLVEDNSYSLSGETMSLSLFAGNYKTLENNGIEYIIPTSYDIELFKASLSDTVERLLDNYPDVFSDNEKEALMKKSYRKVIVGVWPSGMDYNNLEVMDEVILFRYN